MTPTAQCTQQPARTLDERITAYLRDAPARRGDIGRDMDRPACQIAAALARLERAGVIEQYVPAMQRTIHFRIRSITR
jgi:hypothetical protein